MWGGNDIRGGINWSNFAILEYFQLSVESIFVFTLVLLYYALWLVGKTRAIFSTNEKQN